MSNSQIEEILIHPRAQPNKQYCQQSRRCRNVYLEVEVLSYWQTGLSWFEVVG